MVEIRDSGAPDARPQQQVEEDKPRMTTRYLTKYERARVLGTRALQIRCADQGCTSASPLRPALQQGLATRLCLTCWGCAA